MHLGMLLILKTLAGRRVLTRDNPRSELLCDVGYSGEGEHRFRREAERHSGAKVNSSRSEATLA